MLLGCSGKSGVQRAFVSSVGGSSASMCERQLPPLWSSEFRPAVEPSWRLNETGRQAICIDCKMERFSGKWPIGGQFSVHLLELSPGFRGGGAYRRADSGLLRREPGKNLNREVMRFSILTRIGGKSE
jgi:hypothetical protein